MCGRGDVCRERVVVEVSEVCRDRGVAEVPEVCRDRFRRCGRGVPGVS